LGFEGGVTGLLGGTGLSFLTGGVTGLAGGVTGLACLAKKLFELAPPYFPAKT